MKYTFFLKHPKGDKPSLILLTCYFKNEEKKFVYSTGEKIHPRHWDFETKMLVSKGKFKAPLYSSIKTQLNRYSNKFEEIQARCKKFNEDFTSKILRSEFDAQFKKVITGKGVFFRAYDEFMEIKSKGSDWGISSIKRYQNLRNLLEEFQNLRGYKLTFNSINQKFHSEFSHFSLNDKNHANNTLRRNQGLFKTFMRWSIKNGYTYNDKFADFKREDEAFTKKIALRSEDLHHLMQIEFKKAKLERARDIFVFACSTGMRYGELKLIGKHNTDRDHISLKEDKSLSKDTRDIPLNSLSRFILKKYDCQLPIIANQKQNEYLKVIFEIAGYTGLVEHVIVRGKTTDRKKIPMYKLISTHTARRTFITMMKRKRFSDKLIAKITGHTDLKTLNQYYQVDEQDTKEAVSKVFDDIVPLMKKVN